MEQAADFDVDVMMDASATDEAGRAATVAAATGDLGADIVIDCSGLPATFTEAFRFVRTGGVVVEAGMFVDMGPAPINPNSAICTRNVAALGAGGGPGAPL